MKNKLFYPFLFAAYPTLAMFSYNFGKVLLWVIYRPIIISLIATAVIFAILGLLLKNWQKAALTTIFIQILFFSYGHLLHFLREIPSLPSWVGTNRVLFGVYFFILCIGLWLILRSKRDLSNLSHILNLTTSALVVFSIFQITSYQIQYGSTDRPASLSDEAILLTDTQKMPDIYEV